MSLQCRICLDGVEAETELGRLIKPCLCKGTISHVHLKCLKRWRDANLGGSFYRCSQCLYEYRFSRTRIYGIAENPVLLGGISTVLFTTLVLLSSLVTSYFMLYLEAPSSSYYSYYSAYYVSPFDTAKDLVRAAIRILQDGGLIAPPAVTADGSWKAPPIRSPPGILKAFLQKFILGLPLVGASALVHMLSVGLLPVQFLARYRGNRRRENSRDTATLIVIALVLAGAARALYNVYRLTQSVAKRILLKAEDAVLEVN